MDVEDLAVDNRLLAEALLAAILVLDNLALAIAVWAHRLEALNHGAHLAHHRLHTVAVTARALLDSALLAATALALGADDGPLEGKLGDLSTVDILKRDVVNVVDRPGLGRAARLVHAAEHATESATSKATTAKELGEEILGRHTTTASTTFETGLAILVIDLALL